ncbi:MAG: indole-3-glycerol phosphate synthase TrpC [Gammaproteobacteria bacterium]
MSGTDFLAGMKRASEERLATARAALSEAELLQRIADVPAAPGLQLSADGFDLIAEVKRRSPSAGQLATEALEPAAQASAYAAGGAAALSVLTEPTQFAGELAHLSAVAQAVPTVPAMRKDFLVSPYQVLEARAAGAGGVLLIAAMLDAATLTDMLKTTLDLGMFALIEAFDSQDLAHAVPIIQGLGAATGPTGVRLLIGVNCRDLRTLAVDFDRFAELAPQLPTDLPRVAESGVDSARQAARVAELGYGLALVGTALMRAESPANAAAELLAAGRRQ